MVSVERTVGKRETASNRPSNKSQKKQNAPKAFNYNKETKHTSESLKYKVLAKENAFSIARKFNISIQQLAAANGWEIHKDKNGVSISSNGKPLILTEGQSIKIPNGDTSSKKTEKQPNNPQNYLVKDGDTLYSIAEKHNISIRQLAAANGWKIKQDKDTTTILSGNKEIVLSKNQSINIPKSVTKNVGTVTNLSSVKQKTGMSDGLLNIIKGHEGNPENNLEPYYKAYQDSNKVWTVGYGETKGVTSETKRKSEEAYTNLTKNLLQIQADLRAEFGEETFNKMPASLREGVIDLVYNKGFEALNIENFKQAINKNDIKSAVEQLIFTKSIKTNEDMSGLYKRSLARIAHVYNGLNSETKQKLKPVIDNFYAKAKEKVNQNELNKWWNPEQKSVKQAQNSYTVQATDKSLIEIARKNNINYQELLTLNKHLAPDYTIKAGDKINIPVKSTQTKKIEKPLPVKQKLANEITKIKNMDLSDKERLARTEALFDRYAKKYGLPKKAIDIFKAEAQDEYSSWFYIDTKDMTAMAGILDAQTPDELLKSIKTASNQSKETREFAGIALTKKIDKNNVFKLIKQAGGSKEFVNTIKKTGGFEILRHCLLNMLQNTPDKNGILKRFNKAYEDGDYNEVINIFNNITAQNPKEISNELAKTLDNDDDLNSVLYKYQIKKVDDTNILQVLKSNDIIGKICEAENDRAQCKSEILRLFNILDTNYELDASKKKAFLDLVNKEFQPRGLNPSTWWIATSKIREAFNSILTPSPQPKNVESTVFRTLGLQKGTQSLKKQTDKNSNIVPYVERFKPTKQGKLNGRTIVINSGHGGYNPNNNTFDKGALSDKDSVHEWVLNRYMAKQLVEQLRAQGATVILTAGHVKSVSYKDYNADMTISLHADSHSGTSGPRIYTNKGDAKDKKLALNVLNNFVHNKNVSESQDLHRAETTFNLKYKSNSKNTRNIQAKIVDSNSFQILRKNSNTSSDEPSILLEYCNIKNPDEVKDIVFGNMGKDITNSLVNGIIKYWEEKK